MTKFSNEPADAEPRIYRIVRYSRHTGGHRRVIRNNVTLTEAQTHCARKDTSGDNWFDGFDYMPGCAPKKD